MITNRMMVWLQSQTKVARRPPKMTYIAIPIGRSIHAAMVFMPVRAVTVAAPPTAGMNG